jgi:cell division control protein 6
MPRRSGPTVFKDLTKLAFDYVPEQLPHREAQTDRLDTLYRPLLEAGVPVNAFLHGPVGTGKTHTARRFATAFTAEAASGNRTLKHLVVNCRQKFSADEVTLSMIRNFQREFPARGFSVSEKLTAVRRELEKHHAHLIVILDEVDVLLKKSGSDLIYALTRLGEETAGGRERASLLLISQQADALDKLDEATASTFRRSNAVPFTRYAASELQDIVTQRCDLGLHPATWTEEVVTLIGEIASEYGDARYAIELLQHAGALADEEAAGEISAEHVRGAKATVNPTDVEEKVRDLERGHALTLLAIARKMRQKAYIVTSEAEQAYRIVCEEFTEKPRGHTQFWKYLKDLEALGLIDSKVSSRGTQGKTTVISLAEVPAKVLAENLERKLEQ